MSTEHGHEPPLWEAMEACRPGSDDLNDPGMAQLADAMATDAGLRDRYQRLQGMDAKIRDAFCDVAAPARLADRLLARIAAVPREAPAAMPAVVEPRRVSRRRLVAIAAALATTAALVPALLTFNRQPATTASSVVERATQFFAADSHSTGYWVGETPSPADYPSSRDLLRAGRINWRWVHGFLGADAVAYDLPAGGGQRATLYAARRSVTGLPMMAPRSPTFTTAGYSAAAWQDGDMLYVLVVEGDARTYQDCLDLDRAPLT
jgi:hypothetical protein